MARWLVITSFIVLAQACAQKPWVTEARTGNLANLQRYVEVAGKRHRFNRRAVKQLAEAVADREIATADDTEAYERILKLKACASDLYWPLHRRSQSQDEIAAAANLLLLDTGWHDSNERLRSFAKSTDGAWRAVSARAAEQPAMRTRVYQALVDPDARVRRAALMTIQANPLADDGKALLDVVRFDPDESLRASAMVALGETGDQQSVLLARELWDAMVEPVRLAYLQALDASPIRARLGSQILWRIMDHEDSMASVVAASLLFRGTKPVSELARGRLLHALRAGTSSEQLLALATLGSGGAENMPEIRKLALDGAQYVRVAALQLWLDSGRDVLDARRRLETISASRDSDALEAAQVLSLRGQADSIARMEARLTAPHADERIAVSRLLIRLERWDAVAKALVDDHPSVRLGTACQMLAD